MEHRVSDYLEACNIADDVLKYSGNAFLDSISGDSISPEDKYVPSIKSWMKLDEYRAMKDEESTRKTCEKATLSWAQSCFAESVEATWVIVKDGDKGGCFYGINKGNCCQESFTSLLPDCVVSYDEPFIIETEYNGFFTGTFCGSEVANLLLNTSINGFYVACTIIPYDLVDVENRICEIESNIACLERYKATQRTYGNSSRHIENVSNTKILQACNILSEYVSYLKDNKNKGFVRCVVKFGTKKEQDFYEIHRLINSAIANDISSKYVEPLRAFSSFQFESKWSDHLSIPYVILDKNSGKGVHILSIQTIDNISKMCNPGYISNPYMLVRNYAIDENSRRLFDGGKLSGGSFALGKTDNGELVNLEEGKLCCHTVVFGSAGGGKTNTVKQLIHEAERENIPFLVIEAAKKEYHELATDIKNINIYTPGTNGRMLFMNPLEPEEGTLIENQVDMLVRAIVAAHGNEHPIPEGFEGLLKMTYENAGWSYGMVSYHDSLRPFPTFKDVYDNVDAYINSHATYGNEVRQNLVGALSIRAERMYSGALGRVFACNKGLNAVDLLSTPTLIELDDFSESAKTLLTNIIMFKLQSYLSQQGKSRELKRLIIIEEAHNLFRKTRKGEEARDINNEYFDKMLSEIRASGTGLIVCDQRPSIISDAVIENSAIKVIHALEEREDRDIVSAALNLSNIQNMKLRELAQGECLLTVRGIFGVTHVAVNEVKDKSPDNYYCLMCSSRFKCYMSEIDGVINTISQHRINELCSNISMNPYDSCFVKKIVNSFLDKENITLGNNKKCCFLGKILNTNSVLSNEVQRIVLCAYSNELRKG